MKSVGIGTFLILMVSLVNAQQITVNTDEQPDADFSKYKTFYWTSQVDNELDPGLYFLNDLELKAEIRDAVKSEMEGRGYRLDETSPDMIINFRVFDKPVTLKGFDTYGQSYWGGTTVNGPDQIKSYDVKAGTLLVSMLDKKDSRIVWQGFVSGLIDNDAFMKDEVKIQQAVHELFDRFGHSASDYSMK